MIVIHFYIVFFTDADQHVFCSPSSCNNFLLWLIQEPKRPVFYTVFFKIEEHDNH